MMRITSLVILCLASGVAPAEDRISVDTVGTITATAGYSVSDSSHHSAPTAVSLSPLSAEFAGDPSKDSASSSSSSVESFGPSAVATVRGGSRPGQSLALRSRQARGKPATLQQQQQQPWLQQQNGGSGSAEEGKDASYPYAVDEQHRVNEQLYSVKPQTFDNPQSPTSQSQQTTLSTSSSVADGKSDESSEAPITYGSKKTLKNDGPHDDRPVYVPATAAAAAGPGDWSSDEMRPKYEGGGGDKVRSRKKTGSGPDKSRRASPVKKVTADDGWQEVSPNMEIATGYSATVPDHYTSSQETSDSAESYVKSSMGLYQSASSAETGISSIENAAPAAEPHNFNHKQVLSKMNHFDFSNAVSLANKVAALPSREKRLNYQPGGPPVRFAFGGGQTLVPPSVLQSAIKSVKIEQPNYHSIVVPMPVSHQLYAAVIGGGGDVVSSSTLGSQQIGNSNTMQQTMMALPVVHNVFFKTDDNGGGKTMPAIVIPLKPEYLHHLQQQQQYSQQQQQQHSTDLSTDSQNAAGHQRPVQLSTGGGGGGGSKTAFQYQQQTSPSLTSSSLTPSSPYHMQQKPKPSKVKKPFGLTKPDEPLQQQQQQHRVKQPFGLHHQFYNNPFAVGNHHLGHHGNPHQLMQHVHHTQSDSADDMRYAQAVTAPAAQATQSFTPTGVSGHSPLIVKRPHAYGYASPVAMPPAKFVQQAVNKAHQHQLQQQQQQQQQQQHQQQQSQLSAEELAGLVVQQQQPYKATTFHPGFAYLTTPDDDYPYRPIYKDMKKRNDHTDKHE